MYQINCQHFKKVQPHQQNRKKINKLMRYLKHLLRKGKFVLLFKKTKMF